MAKQISAKEAAMLVKDGDTLALGGFGAFGSAEEIIIALAERHRQTQKPQHITVVKGVSLGDYVSKGNARLSAEEGLVGKIFCAHVGLEPATMELIKNNKVLAYMVPLGTVSHMFRAIAGHKPGVFTYTGLKTFADPRLEGSKANALTKEKGEDIVQLLHINGKEVLFYPAFPIHICFIRGTYADQSGNISCTHEPMIANQLEIATAVHNSGGTVVVQVSEIVEDGVLQAHDVKIHSSLVDYVVKASPENSRQGYDSDRLRPEICGGIRVPVESAAPLALNERKICGRRAAMELSPGALINLGIGMPDAVAAVASEEGISNALTLSTESGTFGGVPLMALGFGAAMNPEMISRVTDMFDLYDGGGLDLAVLGAAEIDPMGNVNVSCFNGKCVGPGGFINISQSTPKVCFIGSFTTGGLKIASNDGRLRILQEGRTVKFKKQIEQVTFSAEYSASIGQQVLYITERAVFQPTPDGLMLTEIAPGIDLEKDILPYMEFHPLISPQLRQMDARLFREEPMGLQL